MTLTGHATVLLVPDVPATLAWYRDRLHVARVAGGVPRPNNATGAPGLFDVDVDALDGELRGRGTEVVHGPVDQWYGLRELRVRDPNGYVLAFGQLPQSRPS
ncbi:MAG TPA: hypothetical protein VK874_02555 [Gaiellaceae bacterium]|nr:hypothetical protein [Gaiellaceae bacterium]